jgi:hypothetical protein
LFLTVAHIEKFEWADKPGDEDKPVARTAQQWDSSKGSIFVQSGSDSLIAMYKPEVLMFYLVRSFSFSFFCYL